MSIRQVFQSVLIILLVSYLNLLQNVSAENSPAAQPETTPSSQSTPAPASVEKQPPEVLAPVEKTTAPPAETAIKTPDKKSVTATDAVENSEQSDKKFVQFTLRHRVNDEKPSAETPVEPDLLIILQTLKNQISTQLAKQTAYPLKIETTIQPRFAGDLATEPLPSLTINTQFESSSNGNSHFTLPAVERKIPATTERGEITVNWKGLQGQFNFAYPFKNLTTSLNIAGLFFEEDAGIKLTLGQVTLAGEFDADLIPTKMNIILPSLKILNDQIQLSVKKAVFDAKVEKTTKGVDLSNIQLKIGQADFGEESQQATLHHFELVGNGKVQEEGISYHIQTNLNKLTLPKGLLFDEALEISYSSQLELRRVDVTAVIELQKTARELQKQRQSGVISEEMMNFAMLGKLMEVSPKLLEQSPEISITQLNIKSNHGELQGKLTVSIDGETSISFEELGDLVQALQAQAEFSIDKGFAEKIFYKQTYKELLAKASKQPTVTELADLEKQAMTATKQRLQNYVQQKLLLDIGSNAYKIVGQLQDGQLTVNGQEIALPF
jgi:hypothetical protein